MRVLVADDHALFRDGLISLLEAAEFEVIGQADNGRKAVDATIRLQPDLLLLDIHMPQMNGLEALLEIKTKMPGVKVVILTITDDDLIMVEAIRSGADGYLLKSQSGDSFIASLNGLMQGELAMTKQMATRVIQAMLNQSVKSPDRESRLTQREIELLHLLSEGLSNKAISQRLSISENTVKYHIKQIMQKLGVQNRTEAVSFAAREGLL